MKAFVVEDSPLYFKIYQNALVKFGYDIIGFSTDGKDGLEKLISLKPDLAIIDMALPSLNGLKIGVELLNSSKNIFLIGVSGLDPRLVKENCLNAGFSAFIEKPFKIDDLYKAIDLHAKKINGEQKYG